MVAHPQSEPVFSVTEPDGAIPLSELARPFLIRWRVIAAASAIGLLTGGLLFLVLPTRYTATATFTVDQTRSGSNLPASLAGLAGTFGLSLAGASSTAPSLDFLTSVATSRAILAPLLDSTFPVRDPRQPRRTLKAELHVRGRTAAIQEDKALRKLRHRVDAFADRRSSILNLSADFSDPVFAADVINKLVTAMNAFTVERLQASSRQRRIFTEQQLDQAKAALKESEAAMVRFLEANRSYSTSPLLVNEYQRLQRTVDLKQNVVLLLSKSFEDARLDEAKATPMLVLVDSAVAPVRRSSPRLSLLLPGGFVLGLLVGTLVIAVRLRRARPRSLQATGPR